MNHLINSQQKNHYQLAVILCNQMPRATEVSKLEWHHIANEES
jgi:hypothetical protein